VKARPKARSGAGCEPTPYVDIVEPSVHARKNGEDQMIMMRRALVIALAVGGLSALQSPAWAQEKIKIGMIADFTGPFAVVGQRLKAGMELYMSEHGLKVGGREVEVIYRDVGNGNPAVAKQLAEELVVRDRVSLIGGLSITPEAGAVATVATEAKVPTVLMIAATPALMKASPYFVRVANNMIATVRPSAEWAYKAGKRKAYIVVSDFAPGHEVQATFKKRFTELGGQIVAEDRVPLSTVDYAPIAERIVRADVDVVQMFVPTGTPSITFMRGLSSQGVFKKGAVVIGVGETDEADLPQYDDSVIGVYTSFYFAPDLPYAENKNFRERFFAKYGKDAIPAAFNYAAYDGMHILYKMIESQQGKAFDGTAAVEAIKGYKWNGPRGPMQIDRESRDIIENIYIRRVEKVAGKLQNVVVDTYEQVKPAFTP
jgi:branched-chain amino acid transport system substrate-binding protein